MNHRMTQQDDQAFPRYTNDEINRYVMHGRAVRSAYILEMSRQLRRSIHRYVQRIASRRTRRNVVFRTVTN